MDWECQKVCHRSTDCRKRQSGNVGGGMIAMPNALQCRCKNARDFVVDKNASCGHLTGHNDHFGDSYLGVLKQSAGAICADAEGVLIHGSGNIKLKTPDESTIEIKNAKYIPDASVIMFSVSPALSQLEKSEDKWTELREKARSGKFVSSNDKVIHHICKTGSFDHYWLLE